MSLHPLETYLTDCHAVRTTGANAPETSFYTALSALLKNVPEKVWGYTIGGYQVMKKWLSYRERPLLGRDLTIEEAEYVTEMARRIAAILLMSEALDKNYRACKDSPYAWPKS